jgi:dTDP-4-amino-4,6-dideoxygalactose transaminase
VQAALLAVKLPLLGEYTARRQQHACRYTQRLSGIAGLILPKTQPGRTHIMNQYTVRVPGRRDELRAFLATRGIGSAIYYPLPLHKQGCFRGPGPAPSLPVAEALAEEAISLPVFPEMTEEEQEWVIAAVLEFYAD